MQTEGDWAAPCEQWMSSAHGTPATPAGMDGLTQCRILGVGPNYGRDTNMGENTVASKGIY